MCLDNPFNFKVDFDVSGQSVSYYNLMEICQGGIEIGSLMIDDSPVFGGHRFAGPARVFEGKMYIPMYVKTFFKRGFRIVEIDIGVRKMREIGKVEDLIFIERVEGGKVYWYGDLDKTQKFSIDIEAV